MADRLMKDLDLLDAMREAFRILGFAVVDDGWALTVGAMDQKSFDYLRSRDFPGAAFSNGLRVPMRRPVTSGPDAEVVDLAGGGSDGG